MQQRRSETGKRGSRPWGRLRPTGHVLVYEKSTEGHGASSPEWARTLRPRLFRRALLSPTERREPQQPSHRLGRAGHLRNHAAAERPGVLSAYFPECQGRSLLRSLRLHGLGTSAGTTMEDASRPLRRRGNPRWAFFACGTRSSLERRYPAPTAHRLRRSTCTFA